MSGTIFGIGALEVLVILILILLVFGPERLPEFTRTLGTALRRLRETYVAFTHEFRGELEPIAHDIDEVTREIRQEVQAIREAADLRAILQPYADDINKAARVEIPAPSATPALPATPTTTAPVTSANGVASTSVAASGATTNGMANGTTNAAGTSRTITAPRPGGNGAHANRLASLQRPGLENHQPIELPDDNPWASVGASVRSDKLDDDSPWRG